MLEPHPQILEEQQNIQIKRMIRFVAFWMILAVYPGIQSFGFEKVNQAMMLFEGFCYIGTLFCAISLFFQREWARAMSVFLLICTFALNVYVAVNLIGPYFSPIVLNLSQSYLVPEKTVRTIVVVLLITYIIWPTLLVCFLTHPRVKDIFRNPEGH